MMSIFNKTLPIFTHRDRQPNAKTKNNLWVARKDSNLHPV